VAHSHDISTGRLEWRAPVLGRIGHNDHVVLRGRVSSVLHEIFTNIHGIVDTTG
jgi:hypothetical protein